MAPDHLPRAVSAQDHDPNSMLAFYRRMIAYRQSCPALIKGAVSDLSAERGVLSFIRDGAGAGGRLFCAFNMTDKDQTIALPQGRWRAETQAPFTPAKELGGGQVQLAPYQACFAADATGALA
jgi:alpha-glucosidase